jgi:GT2 family glycosyltransferase
VLLVDNGVEPSTRAELPTDPRLTVITPPRNLGFAGGCNEGVRHTTSPVLVFVNSDAVLAPGAVAALEAAVAVPEVGLVTASVRLADRPTFVNAAGNPMHYLGYTWAGGMGDPSELHAEAGEVTCVSGATFAVRREVWDLLGGFDDEYFAYGEDVDLSMRAWQAGLTVRYEPAAVSLHHYEFGRNPSKWFLLERGRLVNVLTLFEPRTRRYVLPMLVAVEAGSLVPAAAQGWAGSKVAAWRWLWENREYLRERSARVASARRRPDREILPRLEAQVRPPGEFGQSVPEVANVVLGRYWAWARRRLDAV